MGTRKNFNTIRFSKKRVGCTLVSRAMEELSEVIDNYCLTLNGVLDSLGLD